MSPTFRALHNRNYRLYAMGGVVSNTGTWMQRVAQDWLVVLLAVNDGTSLGITTGLQFLPALLLSPYAGLVADRVPKLRLLQVTQTVMALTAVLLGVLAVTGTVEVWHVYVLAFVFGTGSAFDAPARQSFVSEMVGPDRPDQRGRAQLRVLQRRPARRPCSRRPADRRLRGRGLGHRLGDPGQRGQLPRRADRPALHEGGRPAGRSIASRGTRARSETHCATCAAVPT